MRGLTVGKDEARKCRVGYYCPEGTDKELPPETQCPAGHRCPAGSLARCILGRGCGDVGWNFDFLPWADFDFMAIVI